MNLDIICRCGNIPSSTNLRDMAGIVGLGPPMVAAMVRILVKRSCPVGDVALSR